MSANELRVPEASEVNDEPRDDVGRSLLSPAMLLRPNPLAFLSSCLCSFSSRCFSLLLLSAMRSLNDLILGVPTAPVVLERASPFAALTWPGRLRLTSEAFRPLSIPSKTRAGLRGSSGLRRARVGETGTWTSASGRGSSVLRSAAVPGREGIARLSGSALRAFCSCLSFSRASIACNLSWSVSSSSSSVVSPSSCWTWCSDTGRRFVGEGDTELRARRSSYLRRPDGELIRAS